MAMAESMIVHLQHSKRVVTTSAKTQVSANFKCNVPSQPQSENAKLSKRQHTLKEKEKAIMSLTS